jgi:hypothetical protein
MMTTSFKHKTTLTHHNTPARITTYCKSSRGCGNPFRLGDNTPQLLAVFFCPSFLKPALCRLSNIMMVLFGQSLGLVAPSRGITTPFNTVTNTVVSIGVGYSILRLGITA